MKYILMKFSRFPIQTYTKSRKPKAHMLLWAFLFTIIILCKLKVSTSKIETNVKKWEGEDEKGGVHMKMKWTILAAAIVMSLAGCATENSTPKEKAEHVNEATVAPIQVEIKSAKGDRVGEATLTQEQNGVRIKLLVQGLTPGKHGIHVHEIGKCLAPDFQSAGGHFNPFKREHGFNNPKGPHSGDLMNVDVRADGTGEYETIAPLFTLEEGKENSLFDLDGSSLVIHAAADDYTSNPAGNSGDRIACGVIQK